MPARSGHKPPPGFFPQRSLGPPRPWRQAAVHQPVAFHVEPGPRAGFVVSTPSKRPVEKKAPQVHRRPLRSVQLPAQVGEHPLVIPTHARGDPQVRGESMPSQAPAGALQEVVGDIAMQLEGVMEAVPGHLPPQIEVHVGFAITLPELVIHVDEIARARPRPITSDDQVPWSKHARSALWKVDVRNVQASLLISIRNQVKLE